MPPQLNKDEPAETTKRAKQLRAPMPGIEPGSRPRLLRGPYAEPLHHMGIYVDGKVLGSMEYGGFLCLCVACSFLVGWVGGVVLSGKERDGEQAAASADQASLDRRGGGRT